MSRFRTRYRLPVDGEVQQGVRRGPPSSPPLLLPTSHIAPGLLQRLILASVASTSSAAPSSSARRATLAEQPRADRDYQSVYYNRTAPPSTLLTLSPLLPVPFLYLVVVGSRLADDHVCSAKHFRHCACSARVCVRVAIISAAPRVNGTYYATYERRLQDELARLVMKGISAEFDGKSR